MTRNRFTCSVLAWLPSSRPLLHGTAAIVLAVCTILLPISTSAQTVVTGDVSGTVTDPSGASVSGATVQLTSSATGYDKSLVTGPTGAFRFSQLKPDTYRIKVTSSQFRATSRDVIVQLGQVTNANLSLGVSQVTETVQVTAEAPLLQTENANLTTTFNQQQVEQMPNPGGDITYYANTAPGIAMNTSGSGYGNFSAFGLPATSNLFTENGNDENDPFLNLNNSGSSNLLLGKNEVQEVAVVTNGYTGQYGRQAGAVVNYTTKSGTNKFHGDATYDWNGRYLNANEWFNKRAGNPTPFANNNQWSADFGGPIIRNKAYFYVDTEGLRYILPAAQDVYFATPAFQSAVLANIGTVSAAQLPFYTQMMKLYSNAPSFASALPFSSSPAAIQGSDTTGGCEDLAGTAGLGGANPCLNYFHANGKNLNEEWLLTTRVDVNIGSKDVLFGRYKMDHGEQPTSTDLIAQNLFGTHSVQPSYEGQLNETHTFSPRVVNSFIASGLWYTAVFVRNSGEPAALAALPYSTVSFGSNPISTLGGTSSNSQDWLFPEGRNVTQWQITDDISIIKGNHELKFGVNFRRNDISDYDNQILNSGQLNFGSMTDFYNGSALTANGDYYEQTFTANKEVPLAIYSLGLYAQDSWKVKKNLRFTFALRADRNSNAVCQSNCYARLVTPFPDLSHDPTVPYNQIIHAGVHQAFPSIQTFNWQPRIGFTWNPGGKGFVLRGGGGLFSDLYAGILLDNLIANSPEVNTFLVQPATAATVAPGVTGSASGIASTSNTAFINGFASGQTLGQITAASPAFAPPSYYSTANKIINPTYGEWNLEIQQALGVSNVVSINYVGNHGYHLLVGDPGVNAYGFATLPATVPDARFGTVTHLNSGAVSNYHGLVTSFSHRFSHGFQTTVSYVWSHALDEVSSIPQTPFSTNTSIPVQLNTANLRSLNYSNSDTDVRHNLTANYLWNLPGKFKNGLMNEVVGGWQVAGTVYLRSSLPFSAIDVTQAQSINNFGGGYLLASYLGSGVPGSCTSASHPCLSTSQFVAQGTETTLGNIPRNFFRGPHYFNSDFSVGKAFKIRESTSLRLGLNFFNVFNHPNFESPDHDIGSSTFGQILATAVEPTNPYGSYQQAGVSGRLIQIEGKIKF